MRVTQSQTLATRNPKVAGSQKSGAKEPCTAHEHQILTNLMHEGKQPIFRTVGTVGRTWWAQFLIKGIGGSSCGLQLLPQDLGFTKAETERDYLSRNGPVFTMQNQRKGKPMPTSLYSVALISLQGVHTFKNGYPRGMLLCSSTSTHPVACILYASVVAS